MPPERDSEAAIQTLVKTYFKKINLPPQPNLPANHHWSEIIDSIRKFPVTIITGSTGCGKTTQVPQLLLEHELYKNRRNCRMVVTQPRRIAAISVANTVCRDRHWEVGSICGYQVGMDRERSDDTCIEYVTTNVLVEKIIHNKTTEPYTHIIVDEIHERHQDLDCLLFLLCHHDEAWGPRPKIILMSATAEANIYTDYFGEDSCNLVPIEGSVYDVKKKYLEDIPAEICNKIQAFASGRRVRERGENAVQSNKAHVLHPDVMKAVGDLIETFDKTDRDAGQARGAVLLFLPGIAEINQMIRILGDRKDRCRFELIPLHSKIPLEDQSRVFRRTSPHVRKIIVATNIAESSITVPDIRYVVDFCLTKNQVLERETNFASYQIEFCSRANCDQRAGRAGRVQDGIVYRLVSKAEFGTFEPFPIPEMLRCPVDISVLKIKKLGLNEPKEVLRKFIAAPDDKDVARAIITLKEVQAMQLEHNGKVDLDDGDLTILGTVMARLPLDIRLSKLILMGFAFGCFEECVKIAACLSVEDIMLTLEDDLEDYKNRLAWAEGSFSDPLMLMHAFDAFLLETQNESGDDYRHKQTWARERALQFRRLVEAHHVYEDLKQRLSQMGFSKPQTPNLKERDAGLQNFFVMMALCGAFYPHYYALNPVAFQDVRGAMGDHDPSKTMIISGFPEGHGPLYAQAIRAALKDCLHNEVRLSFQSIDAYLTFENHDNDGTPLDAYLCELYRKRRNGVMSVPKVPEEKAEALLRQLNISVDGDAANTEITVLPMSQNYVSSLKKLPLPTESSVKGTITWFEDILTFYMALDERLPKFQEVQNEIEDELANNSQNLVRLEQPEIGMPVLAEFEGKFYRARVVKDGPKGPQKFSRQPAKIAVFFIDFGNRAFVPFVYKLPETMLICNSEAPFAYRAQLAHLKVPDGIIREPVEEQILSKNKQCRAEIFSIVDDTLRVTLFLEIDDEEVSMNDKLIYDKHAIKDQEPEFSQERSNISTMQNLVLRGEGFEDLNHYSLGQIRLTGPRTPLANQWELKPLTRGSMKKHVELTRQSINHVLFGSTSNYQQFVVGHVTKLSPDQKRVQLLQTTLMTKLPMMLPFVALVFSPRAEYRRNEEETKFVGAICGMGGQKRADGVFVSVSEVTDLEVSFSQELNRVDVKIINEIRRLLNEAFCGNAEVYEWTSVPILKIQRKIEDYTLRFFNITDREAIPRDYKSKKKPGATLTWTEIKKSEHYKAPEREREALFRPHPIYRIKDAVTLEMWKLYKSFLNRVKSNRLEVRKTLCPLCCETFDHNKDALEHLNTEAHDLRSAKFRGRDLDDTS